ncbi:hypothetical protein [Streptomyces sp. NK08204]|uniref:hypothetical protein n=1 Tax=Streptomyces sp. NK08204 TaxID=2873260 RepID=UPI001CEC6AE4|nr:hypothetical protein [Streptomyces sp. NK08204]
MTPRRKGRPSTCVFAAYLRKFVQVTGAEDTTLIKKVLTDPDQTMAQSAVLRHLDRRATVLRLGHAFEPWAERTFPDSRVMVTE